MLAEVVILAYRDGNGERNEGEGDLWLSVSVDGYENGNAYLKDARDDEELMDSAHPLGFSRSKDTLG